MVDAEGTRKLPHLDGELHAGDSVDAALAYGVGPHAYVLLQLVDIRELRRACMQLL